MAIILDVVVIRDLVDSLIVAYRICSAWQWFHARSVVPLKGILSREGLFLKPLGIEGCYCFFDISIQLFQRGIDILLQFFNQMRFEILDVVFYRWLLFVISNYR